MWQPRQTPANNSSPLISTKRKPWLNARSDAEGPVFCACAANDNSESAAVIVTATLARRIEFACIIRTIPQKFRLDDMTSGFDHALV